MAGKSDYLENIVLNLVLRNIAYTPAATVYVALYSAAPTDVAGSGTEFTAGTAPGYVRMAVTFSAAAAGTVASSADVLFPVATGAWPACVGWAIFDAATAGNMLYIGTMTSTTLATNDQMKIAAGALTVSED